MRIAVGIYTELKPGDNLRVVSEDNITLVLHNGKSVGTKAVITNINGRVYLVTRQAVVNDKRKELHHNSQ